MKRCALGLKCPYVGQRQHTQEYFHDGRPTAPTASTGPVSHHHRVEAEAKARNTILTAAEKRTNVVVEPTRPSRLAKTQANKRIEQIQSGVEVAAPPAPPTTVKAIKKLRTVPPVPIASTVTSAAQATSVIDQEMEYVCCANKNRA